VFLNIGLVAGSFFFILCVGELAARIYYVTKHAVTGNTPRFITIDDNLGWRATPDYKFSGYRKDAGGNSYPVKITTNQHGFRMFGDVTSSRKKVLFIGDSFTQALHVSDDKTYYGILSQRLPIEVFAYGAGGYGTLQEYMILKNFVQLIDPDVILMQYTSNDFVNNDYELEFKSSINNNRMRRPYLTKEGQIVYALPKSWARFRDLVNRHSVLLYVVIDRLDAMRRVRDDTIENDIISEGISHSGFRRSVKITETLLRMVKASSLNASVFAFGVDDYSPYYEEFRQIAERNGIKFIDGIPQAIGEAQRNGLVTRASDGSHWNEAGHKVAAEQLLKHSRDIVAVAPYRAS
jgi:lysophospholipase L1-like esterase